MAERETTHRIQRPELLGLLHEMLAHDLVTAKIQAPARDRAESDRETAIIATPRRQPWLPAVGFVLAFVAGFAMTFTIVSA